MQKRYLRVETSQGNIFLEELYEEGKNKFFLGRGELFDIDTQEPVKMIDNYIKYVNLDKCLEYARIDVSDDEEIYFTPYHMGSYKEQYIKDRAESAANSGISLMDQAYSIIKDGISEKEAKQRVSEIVNKKLAEIRQRKEEELKKIQEEKEKYGWFVTFYNTFGDLFEEEENKYKYNR